MPSSSRDSFRAALTRLRRVYTPMVGSFPLCDVCMKPIQGGGEIHESIITRGMIRDVDKASLILVRENSNLVHSRCHPERGRGNDRVFKICCINLLAHEQDGVIEWLARIECELPNIVPQVRRDYLNAIENKVPFMRINAPKTYSLLKEMLRTIVC